MNDNAALGARAAIEGAGEWAIQGYEEAALESDRALNLLNDMLWNCVVVAGPILAATLIVGVLISVLQVATQLQEATLTYVPKLLIVAILLIALGPWMIGRITDFAHNLFLAIPTLVQ